MPSRPPVLKPHHYNPVAQRQATQAALDKRRGSAATRGYDTAWRALRAKVLAAEPYCRFCAKAGRVMPATDVDHILPVALRPDLRLARENLRPLCHMHHSQLTGRRTQFKKP